MGQGTIVKASGSHNARLAIVGMAPAIEEVRQGLPFVGPSGKILNDALSLFGMTRSKYDGPFVTNCVEFPIARSVFDLPTAVLATEIQRLEAELREVAPNCVLALGDEPLQILTGKTGIAKWRGSILPSTLIPGLKVVPSYHTAWILRGKWKWLPVFRHVDLKRAIQQSGFPETRYPHRESFVGPSLNDALNYIEECKGGNLLSVDIETFYRSEIACVGIGVRPDQAMCIPLIHGSGDHYWTLEEECEIWKAFAGLLQSEVPKTAQNASFEWLFFWRHGIYPQNLRIDTMTAHHCLYPDWGKTGDPWGKKSKSEMDNPGHGLAFINSQYTETPYYKDDGREWTPKQGESALWNYNCHDVMVTHECATKEEDELREEGLWDVYQEYYIRPFYHAIRMEWDGTPFNETLCAEFRARRMQDVARLSDEIKLDVGYELNVRSPKQMQDFLYTQRGYRPLYNRKTKRPTANREALEYFVRTKGDTTLLKLIELNKIRDEISDVLTQKLDERGYIHTHFNQGGTDGGRWSSSRSILGSGTNLQNIPRTGIARQLFLPD